MTGYLSLILHAHLPYVRHPEHEEFLEERWFFEAVTETYVPILNVMEGLLADGIDFRLTMSLTPPLAGMMSDPLLQERYIRYIVKLIELTEKEIHRTRNDHAIHRCAQMYYHKFLVVRSLLENKYGRNLIAGFKKFQDLGKLEVMTCAATHGFLPLLRVSREAVRAQVSIGVSEYTRHFGRPPRGIWLPECAFYPGLDEILAEFGIRYFIMDSHGVLHASSIPRYTVYTPLYCPSGVAVFGRDWESGKQVWSAREGYPGDFVYRDFYRDVGFDLDFEYIKPYIHRDGIRIMTGVKYYKITGHTDHKQPYDPHAGWEKAASHAGNFLFNRERQIEHLASHMPRPPIVVAPYDAELFGHWWYEGVDWLNFVMRKTTCDSRVVKLITPKEYLEWHPKNQVAMPSESSWGNKGYSEVWCNGSNDWVYRHLHEAAWRMTELARTYPQADSNLTRALNQAARELLLAQSSDWAFIMNSKTSVEYAVRRTKEHLWRFNKLYCDIKSYSLDMNFVAELEWKDNIFPAIDYHVFA